MNDLSGGKYSITKDIKFKTPMLRPNLYHYSDAYIVAKGTVAFLATVGNKNDNTEK